MRLALHALALMLLIALPTQAQTPTRRVALVIGIDTYQNVQPLTRARNDANAIAEKLTGLGFEVILRTDANRRDISAALAEFEERLRGAEVGMFFFAGHGVEIRGTNVLLPADIPATLSESILLREGLLLTDLAQTMTDSGVRFSALIIDACRDNPLPRSAGRSVGRTRGLGRTDAPRGTYVVYSAGIGEAALDRLGDNDPSPNSVFTRHLVPALATPGRSLDAAIKEVREQVRNEALSVRHQQNPAIYDQATGDLFLTPQAPAPTATAAPPPAAAPAAPPGEAGSAELVFWQSVQASARPAELEAYLARWPQGVFAPLARSRLAALATPRAAPAAAAPMPREAVMALQRALAALGLDPGPADGSPGPRTTAAIRAVQIALAQTADGQPSAALLDRLNQPPPLPPEVLAAALASLASAERSPPEGARLLELATRLSPRDAALWLQWGDAQRQRGAVDAARRAYATAGSLGAAEAAQRLAALPNPAAAPAPAATRAPVAAAAPTPAPGGRCGVSFAGTRTQDGLTGFAFRNNCPTTMAFRAECAGAPTLARGDLTIGANAATTVWAPARGAAGTCRVTSSSAR